MPGKKSRGSWDSNDKRTKAGRDDKSYHPHRDTEALLGAIGSVLSSGFKKKKSANNSKAFDSKIVKTTNKELEEEIIKGAKRAEDELEIKKAKEEVELMAEFEKQRVLDEILNTKYNDSREEIIDSIDLMIYYYETRKSPDVKKSARLKAEKGILKLTQIGAEIDASHFRKIINKIKHRELFPLYLVGAGVIIMIFGFILGTISRTELIFNKELEFKPYRNTKYLVIIFGLIISCIGAFRYFKKEVE